MENAVKAGIFGVCIGDALGVPVEFRSREQLKRSPVTKMRALGGLAGIYYGFENIPEEWVSDLVRKDDIEVLYEKLQKKLMN